MGKVTELCEVSTSRLVPYEKNAKIHSREQVEKIAESIKAVGFLSPCLIDKNYNIIAGHGRIEAAKLLGIEKVPCVFIEGLTDEERRVYILADNRLTELGDWDLDILFDELTDLTFEMAELTGFEVPEQSDFFVDREKFDTSRQEGNDEYNAFLDKFELKKTTDDCYTPDEIYEAVAEYVARTYKVDREKFVRPFYPNGDYTKETYPEGCTVVDNPPFSILSEILKWYTEHGIRFFLFAPTLTLFSSSACTCTALPCGVAVTYENGASVNTSFLTNLEDESLRVKTCPELHKAVEAADKVVRAKMKKELPKYTYPDHVITSAGVARLSKYGVDFSVTRSETKQIEALDAQKELGKAIYGKGYLLSEKAAAEKAAAEKAADKAADKAAAEKVKEEKSTVWTLSDREKEIVRGLSENEEEQKQ